MAEELGVLGAVVGLTLLVILVLWSVAWFALPFMVWAIRGEMAKLRGDLGAVNNCLLRLLEELREVQRLTDPDGSRKVTAERHDKEEQERRAAAEAEAKRAAAEQRRQKELAREQASAAKAAEQDQRRQAKDEEKRLSLAKAKLACPNCGKETVFRDLRPGSEHTCPLCRQTFTITD